MGKSVKIDAETFMILEDLAKREGLAYAEILRRMIRAWRYLEVYQDKFRDLNAWDKAKVTAQKVRLELLEESI